MLKTIAVNDNSTKTKHIHHYQRHVSYSYPVHPLQRFYSLVLVPTAVLLLAAVLVKAFAQYYVHPGTTLHWHDLIVALLYSFLRLTAAYALALIVAVPLAIAINTNALTERLLLPTFDIIQSIPVLAFFPVMIIFFVRYNLLNFAAILIIFLSMLWNIVFSLVGGLRVIPGDIKDAAFIYKIHRLNYFRQVLIPAIVPYIVTGSLLAWAQGWNILIVAEVLHTYIPNATSRMDLQGVGSVLVHASAAGDNNLFLAAIFVMVVGIAVMNILIWQRLLRFAERYRFE